MKRIEGLDEVWIPESSLLVTPLEDYYKTKPENTGQFSTEGAFEHLHDVGVIESVGSDMSESLVGHVVFYMPNVSMLLTYPGIEPRNQFLKVDKTAVLSIRADESKFDND